MSKRPSRRPKQVRRSSSSGARTRAGSAPVPQRRVAQVLEGYAGIATEADPLQIEMSASAMAGPGLEAWWEGGVPHPSCAMLALLEHVRDARHASDALALARGLAALAPEDEEVVQLAQRVTTKLRFLGARPTPASAAVGTATPTRAVLQADCWGDQLNIHVEFGWADPDLERHTLTVLVDSNLATIKDAFLAPPIDELLQVIQGRLDDSPADASIMELRDCSMHEAMWHLAEALRWTRESLGVDVGGDDGLDLFALIEARWHALADAIDDATRPDAPPPAWHARPSELDALDASALAALLIDSDEYAAEQAAGANAESAAAITDFVHRSIEGAARFGPQAAEAFALFALEHAVTDDTRDALRAGVVPTLRAWARLTHRVLELPEPALEVVLAGIEHATPLVAEVIDGHVGPVPAGFAQRLVAEMQARGVDLQDEAQVAEFMRVFNEEMSFEERGRILGIEDA